ncbi:hypothetical protein [Deminuibacter soli]|uniref:Uncharacterized protein n=1 Tax=Deminuibacter soli TaxID=2291815 RepID=A0A3E1NQP7_9BACT|nr:hypothetical protein [Deminuibacter soli]RFM30144.1 hypothetical protein DXN05_04000 [Deminuibacter soli]
MKQVINSSKKLLGRSGLGWIGISVFRLIYDQENILVPVLQYYATMLSNLCRYLPALCISAGKQWLQHLQASLHALSRSPEKRSFHYK